jgi:hypothetical protein
MLIKHVNKDIEIYTNKVISHVSTISVSNYFYTPELNKLSKDPEHTIRLIAKLVGHYFLITDFEKVPSTPEQLYIIAKSVYNNYPQISLGDLKIALENGITGVYGSNFGSIRIDSVGQWINQYFKQTWPEIEARCTQKQMATPMLPPSDNVFFVKRVDPTLQDLINKKREFKARSKPKKYNSLEEYCIQNNIDYIEYMQKIEAQYKDLFSSIKDYKELIKIINDIELKKINNAERKEKLK